jgi:all-trans-retinol dehydrogenase (NAD+)
MSPLPVANLLQNASIVEVLQALRRKLWAKTLVRVLVRFYGAVGLAIAASYLFAKRKEVRGKTVLITGGAAGLGKAMAEEFAKRGAKRLVLWDIAEKALEQTRHELESANVGLEVLTSAVDISKRETIYAASDELLAKVGFVDVVINNAGILGGKPILEQDDRRIQMVFDVNTMALFWTTKKFLPSMLERNEGHIVVVSSLAGIFASPLMVDYSASKFAAKGFTDALRLELSKFGSNVKTLCVCPAAMRTELFKGFEIPGMPAMRPEYVARKVADSVQSQTELLIAPFLAPAAGILNAALCPVWMVDLFNKPAANVMGKFDGTKADSVFAKMEANRSNGKA